MFYFDIGENKRGRFLKVITVIYVFGLLFPFFLGSLFVSVWSDVSSDGNCYFGMYTFFSVYGLSWRCI